MSQLTSNCIRCGTKNTAFFVEKSIIVGKFAEWVNCVELFCVCKCCKKTSVFTGQQSQPLFKLDFENGLERLGYAIDDMINGLEPLVLSPQFEEPPPEHLPTNIESIFKEGNKCMVSGCYNAAATMYRLCLDILTTEIVETNQLELPYKTNRSLGLRLKYLLDNSYLPEALRDLSECIKEDGNDGAHQGNLTKDDAWSVYDFCYLLLERFYTEPAKISIAKQRIQSRRNSTK